MLYPEGAGVGHDATGPYLEGFVGELRTYPSSHVTVGITLVLVEHIHNTAVVGLGKTHLVFDNGGGLSTIVDVCYQVFDAIYNDQIGAYLVDSLCQQVPAFLPTDASDVENVKEGVDLLALIHLLVEKGGLCLLGILRIVGEGYDPVGQDLLGGLDTLLGVVPEDTDGGIVDTLQPHDVLLHAAGHDNRQEEGLAALGLSCVGNKLGAWKTADAVQPEQELHGRELRLGGDPVTGQFIAGQVALGCLTVFRHMCSYQIKSFFVHYL